MQRDSAVPLVVGRPAADSPTRRLRADHSGGWAGRPFKLGTLVNRLEGNVDAARQRTQPPAPRDRQAALEGLRARAAPVRVGGKVGGGWRSPSGIGPGRGAAAIRSRRLWRGGNECRSDSAVQVRRTRSVCPDKMMRKLQLVVLVRSLVTTRHGPLGGRARRCTATFEDPKGYREAVRRFRAFSTSPGRAIRICVAPPRIFKTGEDWILQQVRSSEADGYLARNYDRPAVFRGRGRARGGLLAQRRQRDSRRNISTSGTAWNG